MYRSLTHLLQAPTRLVPVDCGMSPNGDEPESAGAKRGREILGKRQIPSRMAARGFGRGGGGPI